MMDIDPRMIVYLVQRMGELGYEPGPSRMLIPSMINASRADARATNQETAKLLCEWELDALQDLVDSEWRKGGEGGGGEFDPKKEIVVRSERANLK
jgi:hypothetical protein